MITMMSTLPNDALKRDLIEQALRGHGEVAPIVTAIRRERYRSLPVAVGCGLIGAGIAVAVIAFFAQDSLTLVGQMIALKITMSLAALIGAAIGARPRGGNIFTIAGPWGAVTVTDVTLDEDATLLIRAEQSK